MLISVPLALLPRAPSRRGQLTFLRMVQPEGQRGCPAFQTRAAFRGPEKHGFVATELNVTGQYS